jgi:DNA-directed RNA polymerase subunit L
MKIKILKQTENELKIELEGAGHGICNLLQKKLLENKDVDQAGYDVPHPLANNQVIYVRMKGTAKPKDALLEAAQGARETNQAFGKALKAVLKS